MSDLPTRLRHTFSTRGLRPLDEAADEIERLRAVLQRLADCDWVITPGDRMDAVRKIARDALGGYLS